MESVTDEDELSPEEKQLIEEIEDVKDKLDTARFEVQDTTFYDATIEVVGFGCVKMRISKQLRSHLSKINGLDWAVDGQHLVTASQDGKMIVWDAHSGNKLHMKKLNNNWVMNCAYCPDNRFVCSGGLDNEVSVYGIEATNDEQSCAQLRGHTGYISYLQYQSNDKLISGSGDKNCIHWDLETSTALTEFKGHETDVTCLDISKTDPNIFLTSSTDKTCRLWDTRIKNGFVQTFVGHESDINGVCFFPQASFGFVSGSDDRDCRLWDLRSDQCIAIYRDDFVKSGCTCVTVSRSGRLICAGYDDYTCHLWDLLREENVGTLSGHDNRVSVVKTDPSGVAIASASWDSKCFLWTGRSRKRLVP